jgi:hypothetical protein
MNWTAFVLHYAMLASFGLEYAAPNSLDVTWSFCICQELRCLELDLNFRLKASFINSSLPSPLGQVEYDQQLLQLRRKPSCSQALCFLHFVLYVSRTFHSLVPKLNSHCRSLPTNSYWSKICCSSAVSSSLTHNFTISNTSGHAPVIKFVTIKYMEVAKEDVNKKAKKEERLVGYIWRHTFHK